MYPTIQVSAVQSSGEEHGVLVQQILETQKELQDGNKTQKGVEIVSNILNIDEQIHRLSRS